MEHCSRPRFKFATALQGRVLVRRLKGKWDVLVSPQDAKGFVENVFRVAAQVEERDVEA
jgi:(2Fe-2S) ferredoxin